MGNGCVVLLNPFRGAFHDGADIDLSVTASTPNTNYSNVRTANKVKYNPNQFGTLQIKSNQTIPDQTNYSHKSQKEAEERGALYLTIATLYNHFAKNITIHTKEKTTKNNPKQP